MSENNKPEQNFRSGAIQTAVWKNEGSKGVFYTIGAVTRTFYDKENKPQNTGTLRASDVKDAEIVLDEAYKYIRARVKADRTEEAEN